MSQPYRVALLGFRPFERNALASYFRLASNRTPAYEQVSAVADAHFLIVDGDQPDAARTAATAGRLADAVFIGGVAPPGAAAWMARPIDPLHVLRELDTMAAAHAQRQARPMAPGGGFVAVDARPPAAPARRPPRALLVDDSEIALRFLQTRLERLSLTVDRATTSDAALALLAQRPYDLVFLDVELGEDSPLDGLSLCQLIRRQYRPGDGPGTPVLVFVSARHNEVDRARGTLAGADAYLGKPLDEAALENLLRRHGLVPPPAPTARV